MNKLVFGSDPEFFASYTKDGNPFVLPPAFFREYLEVPFVEDIRHPIFIDQMRELGVLIMEDGVAFEETVRPSTNWKELFERIQIGKKILSDFILSKFPDYCDADVKTIPTINYDIERWGKESKEFRNCLIFGCDQDWDAFNYQTKLRVVNAHKHPFRYGGGHIHVSGSEEIKNEPILAVKCLALSAGLANVAFSKTPELDKARTYLYGKPGKFRPQTYSSTFEGIPNTEYGIEYRTPSNGWTACVEQATEVFKWMEIGIRNLLEGKLGIELLPNMEVELQETIVNCNQEKAREMLSYVESRI